MTGGEKSLQWGNGEAVQAVAAAGREEDPEEAGRLGGWLRPSSKSFWTSPTSVFTPLVPGAN